MPTNWKTHTVCTLAARSTCKLGATISWPSKWPWAHICERGSRCKGYSLRTKCFLSIEPRNKPQSWLHHNCAVINWAHQSPEQKRMNNCHLSFGYPASKPPANVYENFHLPSAKYAKMFIYFPDFFSTNDWAQDLGLARHTAQTFESIASDVKQQESRS